MILAYSPKKLQIMSGFAIHSYFVLSASEAGDAEIQQMFRDGLVESYSAMGAVTMWHLSHKGRVELEQLKKHLPERFS